MVLFMPLAMNAQQALPYDYGFENNDLSADGWTMVDPSTGYTPTGIIAEAKRTGDYGFRFGYNTTPPQYLISPELTGTDNGVDVSFYYKNLASYTETFTVGYSTSTNATADFIWDNQTYTAPSEWTEYNNVFPSGTKYVAIKYTANDQYKMGIDDFSFKTVSSCPAPKNLAVNCTGTTAVISWNSDASSWNLDVNGTVTSINQNP